MLNRRKKYLQIALNSTLEEAHDILVNIEPNDRILIEVGTPMIKQYGMEAIKIINTWWTNLTISAHVLPYIVADLKTMDRGDTEVALAQNAGASGAVALGQSPLETLNVFIESCRKRGLDSMVDMMNIEYPTKILRNLKKLPDVVILHRGVDEENFNRNKPVPYIQINKIRATFDVMISVAGGDTIREVQRAIFNDANIVVVWKEFYASSANTGMLTKQFLKEIK